MEALYEGLKKSLLQTENLEQSLTPISNPVVKSYLQEQINNYQIQILSLLDLVFALNEVENEAEKTELINQFSESPVE
jgi:hypothetical protein